MGTLYVWSGRNSCESTLWWYNQALNNPSNPLLSILAIHESNSLCVSLMAGLSCNALQNDFPSLLTGPSTNIGMVFPSMVKQYSFTCPFLSSTDLNLQGLKDILPHSICLSNPQQPSAFFDRSCGNCQIIHIGLNWGLLTPTAWNRPATFSFDRLHKHVHGWELKEALFLACPFFQQQCPSALCRDLSFLLKTYHSLVSTKCSSLALLNCFFEGS